MTEIKEIASSLDNWKGTDFMRDLNLFDYIEKIPIKIFVFHSDDFDCHTIVVPAKNIDEAHLLIKKIDFQLWNNYLKNSEPSYVLDYGDIVVIPRDS